MLLTEWPLSAKMILEAKMFKITFEMFPAKFTFELNLGRLHFAWQEGSYKWGISQDEQWVLGTCGHLGFVWQR